MPNLEKQSENDAWTATPILIFQIASYANFSPIESMLFNYIALESLNFIKNSTGRNWVTLSTSNFANERGYKRQRCYEAIRSLLESGIIESREVIKNTFGGPQKGQEYRLVSNAKLALIHDALRVKGVRGERTPLDAENLKGVRGDRTPCQARPYTLSGQTVHLVRGDRTPLGVKLLESLGKKVPNKFLININKFLNKVPNHENSFLELYLSEARSKLFEYKIKTQTSSILSQYGYFKTFVAMYACLFDENPNLGDFSRLKAFIKKNYETLQDAEEKIATHGMNFFNKLIEINESIEVENLESFRKTFRRNASVSLIQMKLDLTSSEIFLYESIEQDLIHNFENCNYNIDRFTKDFERQVNLYFKAKILGREGLNYV